MNSIEIAFRDVLTLVVETASGLATAEQLARLYARAIDDAPQQVGVAENRRVLSRIKRDVTKRRRALRLLLERVQRDFRVNVPIEREASVGDLARGPNGRMYRCVAIGGAGNREHASTFREWRRVDDAPELAKPKRKRPA